jgi:hypothetical protein
MRLRAEHAALSQAITIHKKTVRMVSDYEHRLLKPVSYNDKLGNGSKTITKGAWKGFPVYSLTLEERSTCSRTCQQWANCFGNNMAFAHRIKPDDPDLLMLRLSDELAHLSSIHPEGFVVRLHILGDFFSAAYAQFWVDALLEYPALRVFGYTHRSEQDIMDVIRSGLQNSRAWIRFSDKGGIMSANVNGEGIQCPEQTGKTQSCMTCALCWSTTKPIAFKEH